MYKYGFPEGLTDEEKSAIKERIKQLQEYTDSILHDPSELEKIYRNARISSQLRPCDLNKQFTI